MADNIKTQPGTGTDPDVRTTELASGKHVQHVRLDFGSGTAERQADINDHFPTDDAANRTWTDSAAETRVAHVIGGADISLDTTTRPLRMRGDYALVATIPDPGQTLISYIDEVSASVTYLGKALAGSDPADVKWQIKKIETTGGVTKFKLVDGSPDFVYIWDDRATYTYI